MAEVNRVKTEYKPGEGEQAEKPRPRHRTVIERLTEKRDAIKLQMDIDELLKLRDKPDVLKARELELNNWFNLLRDEYGEPDNEEDEPGELPSVAKIIGGLSPKEQAALERLTEWAETEEGKAFIEMSTEESEEDKNDGT